MISDNFKIAILLYVYYMGAIETWPTLYLTPGKSIDSLGSFAIIAVIKILLQKLEKVREE